MNKAKFIIVKDEIVANKMLANGFQMISKTHDTYTFINAIPHYFNFDDIDIKKLVYTDRLTF